MSEFNNVTVVREANIFFNGGVTSRTIIFPDGTKKTLGIMQPGEYEFTTSCGEIMEILAGDLDVHLAEFGGWKVFSEGMSFDVAANETFKLKVKSVTDYCCTFLK